MLATLFMAFALPFFLRHSNMEEDNLPSSISRRFRCQINIITAHSHVIYSQILFTAADRGRSVSAVLACFGLFPNLILHNCAIRVCSMQYVKMVDLDRNQLCRRQKLCIMEFMHYSHMHYSHSTVYIIAVYQSCGNIRVVYSM